MECSICTQIFNETNKKPRNLGCGHTYCESCLDSISKHSVITCPNCHFEHSNVETKSLPINYIASNLAAAHREKTRTTSFCPQHPKEFIRFYCNTCRSPICIQCMVHHSGHEFVKQQESVCMMYTKCQNLNSFLDSVSNALSSSVFELEKLEQTALGNLSIDFEALQAFFCSISTEISHRFSELAQSHSQSLYSEREIQLEYEEALLKEFGRIQQAKTRVQGFIQEIQTKTDSELKGQQYYRNLLELADMIDTLQRQNSQGIQLNYTTSEVIVDVTYCKAYIRRMVEHVSSSTHLPNSKICFFGDKNKLMSFDLTTQKWELQKLQAELNYYSAAVSLPDGSVLITGGGSSHSTYKFKDGKLESQPPMNQARKEHAAVALMDSVYVIGGYDGTSSHFLSSCEVFNGGNWEFRSDMNIARCAFSATKIAEQFIFIFGGYDGIQRLGSIQKYDAVLECWVLLQYTLNFPLSNCACFSHDSNKIVVLGGGFSSGFSLAVEQLDLDEGVWRSLPMMGEGRDLRNKIVLYDGKAYCIGGYNFRSECLDLLTETWSQIPNYMVSDNLDSWACALAYSVQALQSNIQ